MVSFSSIFCNFFQFSFSRATSSRRPVHLRRWRQSKESTNQIKEEKVGKSSTKHKKKHKLSFFLHMPGFSFQIGISNAIWHAAQNFEKWKPIQVKCILLLRREKLDRLVGNRKFMQTVVRRNISDIDHIEVYLNSNFGQEQRNPCSQGMPKDCSQIHFSFPVISFLFRSTS